MCRSVASQGVETLIATTDANGQGHLGVPLAQMVDYQGQPTIFFKRQWHDSFQFSGPMSRWLHSNVGSFDVVHIHGIFSHPCMAAAAACQRLGVPYVVRPFGSLDPWSMRRSRVRKQLFWHLIVRRMLVKAAAIHYTTSEERRLAELNLGLGRGLVIPLGVDPDLLNGSPIVTACRNSSAEPYSAPYVLFLGRLHPKKGVEQLIQAFLDVTQEVTFAHWRLLIAGDGELPYVQRLRAIVMKSDARQRVRFLGWLSGAEKAIALQRADLFALPSYQENFGVAVVEALASGVPVLVSPYVNLADEIARNECGWVADIDRGALREGLAHVMKHDAERRRRGAAGKELVRSRFTWPAIAQQLVDLYGSLADAKPSPSIAQRASTGSGSNTRFSISGG
jgi:glycosyltransferase involved in cell wall biosynthesis